MWKGVTANRNDAAPSTNRANMPFKACIDAKWLLRTGSSGVQFKAHDPVKMSILNVELPYTLFNQEDLEWLADEEDV